MMLEGIHLDRASRVPLRNQLAGQLESRILGGQIGPGRKLPSVRRVEELLGLHRNTVAAAYRDLVQAGLARTRPGSGVYARSPSPSRAPGVGTLVTRGPGTVAVRCDDASLKVVLEAELRNRFALRIGADLNETEAAGVPVRLALPPGFLRILHELERPSLMAIVSGCERAQRLASAAVLLLGGEGLACLPVSTGDREGIRRSARIASIIMADYAALPWARNALRGGARALPLISSHSASALTVLLRRSGRPGPPSARRRWSPADRERSLRSSVHEP